ncbi:MAG: hypothetical protein ACYTF7_03655 [Planctomycetota bacterium]|jgi:probable HAF family extracellular repeat protein
MSSTGDVIAGYSQGASGNAEAFRWTDTSGMTKLGYLPRGRDQRSIARAVSADGNAIVGNSQSGYNTAFFEDLDHAFVWTQDTGMIDLQPIENANDFSTVALDVSADASYIVGRIDPLAQHADYESTAVI